MDQAMSNEDSSSAPSDERREHTYTFVITQKQSTERLDSYITHSIANATRTRVQKGIDSGIVTVNGRSSKANYRVRAGDVIEVRVMKQPPLQLIPQDIPLDVVYEDDSLIVIRKPAGILAHPGLGNRSGTLVNAVLWHMGMREPMAVLRRGAAWGEDGEQDATETDAESAELESEDDETMSDDSKDIESSALRPGIVHRLDRDTTGLMVIGKTYEATLHLATQFAERTVSRQYIALVWGVVKEDNMLIETELGRSSRDRKLRAVVERGGKYAATEVTVLERYMSASLVTCTLRTGRTHQIRVHMASLRHPLVGDPDYGGREPAVKAAHHLYRPLAQQMLGAISRQALHARVLGFTHPTTGERMMFEQEMPEDMEACLALLRKSYS